MSRALDARARRQGIALTHRGADGQRHKVPETTKRLILDALGPAAEGVAPPLMRAPPDARCHLPEWLTEGRAWGIAVQLYELRSARNWGIGDFADLADFCAIAGAAGADFVGVNPLHALFLADPDRCSPFSPSNRRFLNPLYIAVDRVEGYAPEQAEEEEAVRLRAGELVDYAGVTSLKLRTLRRLWPMAPASADFEAFCRNSGEPLRRHALFETLSAELAAEHGAGWRNWPEDYQDPWSGAVTAFADANEDQLRFHLWLQWLAAGQLREAAAAADRAGLRIGLYLDYAVGEAPDGSATWSEPHLYLQGLRIGAPPDLFSVNGQDWGLAPLSPGPLRDGAEFRRLIEAAVAGAGALRIDHAMALWQLFLVPEGGAPAEGAYLRYPIETLLSALAEASQKRKVVVIGEDLGNVPEGFREVMEASAILSYRILYFEERGRGFRRPEAYPRLALACLSTHDLPTLAGWWLGDDIELRLEHGLIDQAGAESQRDDRKNKRRALIRALAGAGALARTDQVAAGRAARDEAFALPDSVAVAAHRFVAKAPSLLAAARFADLVGEVRATNLPGTSDGYPNWRLKASLGLEELEASPLFHAITGAMAAERPRS